MSDQRTTYIGFTVPLALSPRFRPSILPTSFSISLARTDEKGPVITSSAKQFKVRQHLPCKFEALPVQHLDEDSLQFIFSGTIAMNQNLLKRIRTNITEPVERLRDSGNSRLPSGSYGRVEEQHVPFQR